VYRYSAPQDVGFRVWYLKRGYRLFLALEDLRLCRILNMDFREFPFF
jgi:hypothetical protein